MLYDAAGRQISVFKTGFAGAKVAEWCDSGAIVVRLEARVREDSQLSPCVGIVLPLGQDFGEGEDSDGER